MIGRILKKLGLLFRSLRARIFIIILVVGIVPSVLMRYGIVENYEERAVDNRITTVQNQLMILANHLISNNYLTNYRSEDQTYRTSKEVINAELDMLSNLYEGRVMIINGNFEIIKDTYGISEGKTIISEEVIKCFQGENTAHYDADNGYIELTTPIVDSTAQTDKNASAAAVKGVMLTSISSESISSTMVELSRKALILETLMIMGIVALAIVLSVALTKPFNRVTEAINEVREGYSDESISVPGYVETSHIVDAFNQLLKRMKALDDSRQEFVANVSHELKTPMTSMMVMTELLRDETVTEETRREFMRTIRSQLERMEWLLNALLKMSKLDAGTVRFHPESIRAGELIRRAAEHLLIPMELKGQEFKIEAGEELFAECDAAWTAEALSNVIKNCMEHTPEGGRITVSCQERGLYFQITVEDNGEGISPEELPHIFERFYKGKNSGRRRSFSKKSGEWFPIGKKRGG